MAHLVYAYIENRGGFRRVSGQLVPDESLVSRYLKGFDCKASFDLWQEHSCGPGGHLSVIKWWRGRPACEELAAVKKEFPEHP